MRLLKHNLTLISVTELKRFFEEDFGKDAGKDDLVVKIGEVGKGGIGVRHGKEDVRVRGKGGFGIGSKTKVEKKGF